MPLATRWCALNLPKVMPKRQFWAVCWSLRRWAWQRQRLHNKQAIQPTKPQGVTLLLMAVPLTKPQMSTQLYQAALLTNPQANMPPSVVVIKTKPQDDQPSVVVFLTKLKATVQRLQAVKVTTPKVCTQPSVAGLITEPQAFSQLLQAVLTIKPKVLGLPSAVVKTTTPQAQIQPSQTKNAQSGSVLLGNNTSGKEATTVSDATVGNLNLTGFAGASKSENGVVSVGNEGGERQIVNVGAGKISANSTDAVNGSQLHALATAVSQKLSGNINTKTVESSEKAISQNQDDIAKNQADIAKNIDNIQNLKAETLGNRADVQELERKQENDIKDVVGMQNAIAEQADKNTADIATNKADAKFKGVQTDIANNKTTLAQHTKKIDDNQQAIEAKLGGKVDAQKLAELKTNVDKNQADADAKFTATEVAIAKNTQSITTLDSKVNTFDGRISALDAKVNGFDGRINALDDKFKNGMAAQAALNGLF